MFPTFGVQEKISPRRVSGGEHHCRGLLSILSVHTPVPDTIVNTPLPQAMLSTPEFWSAYHEVKRTQGVLTDAAVHTPEFWRAYEDNLRVVLHTPMAMLSTPEFWSAYKVLADRARTGWEFLHTPMAMLNTPEFWVAFNEVVRGNGVVVHTPEFWRAYEDKLPEHLLVAARMDPDDRSQMNALCAMLRVTSLAQSTQIRRHVRILWRARDKGETQGYQVDPPRRSPRLNEVRAMKKHKTGEQHSFICRLPIETISLILEYLPDKPKQWARLVCTKRSWQNLFKEAWPSFTLGRPNYLHREPQNKVSKPFTALIQTMTSFRGLVSLYIDNVHLCDEHVRVLCGIDTLQSLQLVRGAFLTDKGAALLFQLRALHTVSLALCGTPFRMESSPVLDAHGEPGAITDVGVFALSVIKPLLSINLAGCHKVTDIGVKWLARLKSLERLNLGGCHGLTERAVAEVSRLTSLTSLSFERCGVVTDSNVAALSVLTNLRGLHLGSSDRLTSAGLSTLSTLTKLKALNLGECELLDDECVTTLLAFPKLQRLSLWRCEQLTDKCVQKLAQLPRLRLLLLGNCCLITDVSLRALWALRELRFLQVNGCYELTVEAGKGMVPGCKVEGLGGRRLMMTGGFIQRSISARWWCDTDKR
jgi:hypothetical protein